MKNPDYGNGDQYDTNFMATLKMDGSISTYKRKLREGLTIPFSNVANYTEFETFFLIAVGQEIKYTDPLGAAWRVRIVTPLLEVTTISGTGSCSLKNFTVQVKVV